MDLLTTVKFGITVRFLANHSRLTGNALTGKASAEPEESLETLSNSLGDELHVRFIKPNIKYIELDTVVGTVITEEIPEIYQARASEFRYCPATRRSLVRRRRVRAFFFV